MVTDAAYRKSSAKSRSPETSMLLRVMAAKPEIAAMASRSKGKPLPASAPEPSGITFTRRAPAASRS